MCIYPLQDCPMICLSFFLYGNLLSDHNQNTRDDRTILPCRFFLPFCLTYRGNDNFHSVKVCILLQLHLLIYHLTRRLPQKKARKDKIVKPKYNSEIRPNVNAYRKLRIIIGVWRRKHNFHYFGKKCMNGKSLGEIL